MSMRDYLIRDGEEGYGQGGGAGGGGGRSEVKLRPARGGRHWYQRNDLAKYVVAFVVLTAFAVWWTKPSDVELVSQSLHQREFLRLSLTHNGKTVA